MRHRGTSPPSLKRGAFLIVDRQLPISLRTDFLHYSLSNMPYQYLIIYFLLKFPGKLFCNFFIVSNKDTFPSPYNSRINWQLLDVIISKINHFVLRQFFLFRAIARYGKQTPANKQKKRCAFIIKFHSKITLLVKNDQ